MYLHPAPTGYDISFFFYIQEDDFVQLATMHYYAQFGSENSIENARKVVEDCIPITLIETKSQTKWIQMINAAHLQVMHCTWMLPCLVVRMSLPRMTFVILCIMPNTFL